MLFKFYNMLGNSKYERFKRFMYILILFSIVLCCGFYLDAINISFTKVFSK